MANIIHGQIGISRCSFLNIVILVHFAYLPNPNCFTCYYKRVNSGNVLIILIFLYQLIVNACMRIKYYI